MASSDFLDQAQVPVNCQLCGESETKLKWIDCVSYLCQACSDNIHSKNEALKEHHIIKYKEAGADDVAERHRRVNLDNMVCSEHKGKKCSATRVAKLFVLTA